MFFFLSACGFFFEVQNLKVRRKKEEEKKGGEEREDSRKR
jgi:hypothetical protein